MALSKYERDEMTPSSPILIKLTQVLHRRFGYCLRPAKGTVSEPAYRRRTSMSKKDEAAVRAQVEDWVDRRLTLEGLVGGAPDSAVEGVERSVSKVEAAESVAEELRKAWELGLDPIENLVDVLEARGVRLGLIGGAPEVRRAHLLGQWDDARRGHEGRRPRRTRARFSLAHELGHIVLEPTAAVDEDKAADRFAGAFLAPAAAVFLELGRRRHSISMWELSCLGTATD